MNIVLQKIKDDHIANNSINGTMELQKFLSEWDNVYKDKIKEIDLFKLHLTKNWTHAQIKLFVKMFYHIRGHFHNFLWLLGNFAPNKTAKQGILYNISEEFGEDLLSHEKLYINFANYFGTDLKEEIIHGKTYLPFIKKFNVTHLEWLYEHNWSHKLSAFSAYERLDNIDYSNLLQLAKNLGVSNECLTFFVIHNNANHFSRTEEELKILWNDEPRIVMNAFDFIGNLQINMWKSLSKEIFYNG